MRARLAAMERTFPGRVLVISEFGAESNGLNPSAAPGSYAYQSRLLARHIAVYAADPKLSGMFVWLLRDYPLTPSSTAARSTSSCRDVRLIEGINQKGLFARDGRAKPAAQAVAGCSGRCRAAERRAHAPQSRLPRAIRRRSIVSS